MLVLRSQYCIPNTRCAFIAPFCPLLKVLTHFIFFFVFFSFCSVARLKNVNDSSFYVSSAFARLWAIRFYYNCTFISSIFSFSQHSLHGRANALDGASRATRPKSELHCLSYVQCAHSLTDKMLIC